MLWLPAYIFAVWPLVAVAIWWRFRPSHALAASLLLPWLILPNEPFTLANSRISWDFTVMGLALPGTLLPNKAVILSLSALLGAVLFQGPRLGQLRPRWFDLPMGLWVLMPLISGLANGRSVPDILHHSGHLLIVWGLPYLLGRALLERQRDLGALANACVCVGLISLPLVALELVMSPVFYRFAYGYHPSEQVGASRVMFYRPLLACEDGNQLGMFLASVALLGAWLWIGGGRSTSADAPAPDLVRDALLGGLLVVALLLAQSMGAILLFLFGLAMLFALRWVRFEWLMLGLLAPLVIGAGVRLSGAVSVESLQSDPRVQWLMREGPLPRQRLGTLGWRLKRQEEHLQTALKKPVLGWGHPHWWWNSPKAGYRGGYRPWGLWLLVLGSYGSLGFATWALAVSLPMLVLLRRRPPPTLAVSALAVVLLINVVDGLLNSVFLLPLVPVAGGLLNVFERLGGSARPTRQVAPSTKHRWGHGSGSAREREKAPRSSQSDRGAIK